MATDPICGMTVDESSPLRVEHDGQTNLLLAANIAERNSSSACVPWRRPGPRRPVPTVNRATIIANLASVQRAKWNTIIPSTTTELCVHDWSPAAKYFCPMCAGVESDKPGDCPKCGMALERSTTWAAPASSKAIYTCPMHPEVQQDHQVIA